MPINLQIQVWDGNTPVHETIDIEGSDIMRFYLWVDEKMRDEGRNGFNSTLRDLLRAARQAVVMHAEDCGRVDAERGLLPVLSDVAHPLWKGSYMDGYAVGKSNIAGEG